MSVERSLSHASQEDVEVDLSANNVKNTAEPERDERSHRTVFISPFQRLIVPIIFASVPFFLFGMSWLESSYYRPREWFPHCTKVIETDDCSCDTTETLLYDTKATLLRAPFHAVYASLLHSVLSTPLKSSYNHALGFFFSMVITDFVVTFFLIEWSTALRWTLLAISSAALIAFWARLHSGSNGVMKLIPLFLFFILAGVFNGSVTIFWRSFIKGSSDSTADIALSLFPVYLALLEFVGIWMFESYLFTDHDLIEFPELFDVNDMNDASLQVGETSHVPVLHVDEKELRARKVSDLHTQVKERRMSAVSADGGGSSFTAPGRGESDESLALTARSASLVRSQPSKRSLVDTVNQSSAVFRVLTHRDRQTDDGSGTNAPPAKSQKGKLHIIWKAQDCAFYMRLVCTVIEAMRLATLLALDVSVAFFINGALGIILETLARNNVFMSTSYYFWDKISGKSKRDAGRRQKYARRFSRSSTLTRANQAGVSAVEMMNKETPVNAMIWDDAGSDSPVSDEERHGQQHSAEEDNNSGSGHNTNDRAHSDDGRMDSGSTLGDLREDAVTVDAEPSVVESDINHFDFHEQASPGHFTLHYPRVTRLRQIFNASKYEADYVPLTVLMFVIVFDWWPFADKGSISCDGDPGESLSPSFTKLGFLCLFELLTDVLTWTVNSMFEVQCQLFQPIRGWSRNIILLMGLFYMALSGISASVVLQLARTEDD